jgi:hypothetical protein
MRKSVYEQTGGAETNWKLNGAWFFYVKMLLISDLCYLSEHLTLGNDYVFEQGRAMNCKSIITASVELDNGIVSKVKVGGFANDIGTLVVSV